MVVANTRNAISGIPAAFMYNMRTTPKGSRREDKESDDEFGVETFANGSKPLAASG